MYWCNQDCWRELQQDWLKFPCMKMHSSKDSKSIIFHYVWHQKNQRIWPVHRLKDHVFHRCIVSQENWISKIWMSIHQEDEVQIDSSSVNHYACTTFSSLVNSMNQGRMGWFLYFLTFPLMWAFFFLVAVIWYFLPSIIWKHRAKKNLWVVVIINLFFWWTIIGWIIALAMAFWETE